MLIISRPLKYTLLSSILTLSACGGSSSNPDPIQTDTQKSPAIQAPDSPALNNENSGRVIDGYIESAFVCIDSNSNQICETSEKLKKSDQQGRYLATEFNNTVLLAQVIAGISKDSDDNGRAINTSYVMYSVNDNPKLITPLTSLLYALSRTANGLTFEESKAEILQILGLTESQISQDYIANNDTQVQKISKILISTVQEILSKGMTDADKPSDIQYRIQAEAWNKVTLESLKQLNTFITESANKDLTASELSSLWLKENPALFFTNAELENTTTPTEPTEPTEPTDPTDPTTPNGPADLSAFKKLNGKGEVLADNSTDYQCVTQIKNSTGNVIANSEQRTWILLIPETATFESLGFTPIGFTASDKFWDYSWNLDEDLISQPKFKEANGLIRSHSEDDNVEHFLTLLNENNYCGFSDWTVPTIASLKALNTQELSKGSTIKTLNTQIFKHYGAHLDQVKARSESNEDLSEPYFWTFDRARNNDNSIRIGMNDFTKFQHPSSSLSTEENSVGGKLIDVKLKPAPDVISGGQYHALRAVRYDRYQRLDDDGKSLALTSNDWHCIKDLGPIDSRYSAPRYWSVLLATDLQLLKSDITTNIGKAISDNRCGFNEWRLPSAEELIALKAMNSNQYFIAKNPDNSHKKISSFKKDDTYFWLDVTTRSKDEMQLWSHDDTVVSSSATPTRTANTLLIRPLSTLNNSTCAIFKDKKYCAYHNTQTWQESKATCEAVNLTLALGSRLSDYNDLAALLKLNPGSSAQGYNDYWLADESTGREDYATVLRNNDTPTNWKINSERESRSRGAICTTPYNLLIPRAPTGIVEDDNQDTLTWTYIADFLSPTDYEYSIDAGTNWKTANENPIQIGDIELPVGEFNLRIKAKVGKNYAGSISKSSKAFTRKIAPATCNTEDGANAAASIVGYCYTRHDTPLNWAEAKSKCSLIESRDADNNEELDPVLVSKISAALELDSTKAYWLRGKGKWFAAPDIIRNGAVTRDSSAVTENTKQAYICVK